MPTELIPGLAKRGQPTVLPVLKIIDKTRQLTLVKKNTFTQQI